MWEAYSLNTARSLNHKMFATPLGWMARYVAGLHVDGILGESPGFRKVIISPHPVPSLLRFAELDYDSPAGTLSQRLESRGRLCRLHHHHSAERLGHRPTSDLRGKGPSWQANRERSFGRTANRRARSTVQEFHASSGTPGPTARFGILQPERHELSSRWQDMPRSSPLSLILRRPTTRTS